MSPLDLLTVGALLVAALITVGDALGFVPIPELTKQMRAQDDLLRHMVASPALVYLIVALAIAIEGTPTPLFAYIGTGAIGFYGLFGMLAQSRGYTSPRQDRQASLPRSSA